MLVGHWNPIWRPCDVIKNAIIQLGVPENIGIATWIMLLCWLNQKLWAKIWPLADACRPSWNPIWRPCDVIKNAIIQLGVPENIGIATWIMLLCWLDQRLWAKIRPQAEAWRPSLNSRWRPPGGVFHVSPVLNNFSIRNCTTMPNFVALYQFAEFWPQQPLLSGVVCFDSSFPVWRHQTVISWRQSLIAFWVLQ